MTMKRLPILVGFMAVPVRARANEPLLARAKHRLKMSSPLPTAPVENARTSWYTTASTKPLATLARNQDHERAEPNR